MVHMRQEMERARMVLDLLKKREYVKRECVQVTRAAFESEYREITGNEAEEDADDDQSETDQVCVRVCRHLCGLCACVRMWMRVMYVRKLID